jgi:hypothetical protein
MQNIHFHDHVPSKRLDISVSKITGYGAERPNSYDHLTRNVSRAQALTEWTLTQLFLQK